MNSFAPCQKEQTDVNTFTAKKLGYPLHTGLKQTGKWRIQKAVIPFQRETPSHWKRCQVHLAGGDTPINSQHMQSLTLALAIIMIELCVGPEHVGY